MTTCGHIPTYQCSSRYFTHCAAVRMSILEFVSVRIQCLAINSPALRNALLYVVLQSIQMITTISVLVITSSQAMKKNSALNQEM